MLRKSRIAKGNRRHPKTLKASFPTLEDFLEKRDYNGASTLLNFQSRDISDVDLLLWKAFCAFHNGDQAKAQESASQYQTQESAKAVAQAGQAQAGASSYFNR